MGLFKSAWKKFSLPGMWSSEKKKQKAGSKKEKKAYKKWLKKYGKDKHVKYDRLSKEQQNLLKTLTNRSIRDIEGLPQLSQVQKPSETELYQSGKRTLLDMLSGSPESFEKFKAPIMREYNEKVIPGIAERFSGVVGGQRSSGFQNAVAEAAAMLGENLSAQKESMRMGAIGPALTYAQMPLQEQSNLRQMALGSSAQSLSADPYMQSYIPKPFIPFVPKQQEPGFLHNFLGNIAGPVGGAIGMGVGGPIGGAIGMGLGNAFGQQQQQRQSPIGVM